MSRRRNRGKSPQLVRESTRTTTQGNTALALAEREQTLPLEEELRLFEASRAMQKRARRATGSASKAFSLAWDETEAMGITADMRRSGPGMLSEQDRKDTLYQAYLNNVWISACVDVIAKRITSGGMIIELTEKGTENQAEHDTLHEFLHYINDDEDFLQLIRSIITDLLIYGEAYMEIVSQNGVPYSLHKIDCTTMSYKLDPHGNVLEYIQNMNHSNDTVHFTPDEVVRWWLPDPKAGKKALSPIERILGPTDADAHMADWVRSFFRKGARPPFWIKFPGGKEEASRFVAWLRENYTGQANAHIPMVLYDEAELHEIGKGAVDVDFSQGRGMTRQEILAGYQVPPAIVSQIESGNIGGGTGESQDKSFQFNACDPVKQLIFEKFNDRVVKKGFGIVNWQTSTRYADYRSDETVSTIQDKAIRNGSRTINEVRAETGKQPVSGGDEAIIVTTKEIQPVARLDALADEQQQTAELTLQQAQAQLDMTKTQVDKLKNPPEPPVTPNPPQGANNGSDQAQNAPDDQQQSKQQADDAKEKDKQEQERYLRDLQQAASQVNEILARADEHLKMVREQHISPDQINQTPHIYNSSVMNMKHAPINIISNEETKTDEQTIYVDMSPKSEQQTVMNIIPMGRGPIPEPAFDDIAESEKEDEAELDAQADEPVTPEEAETKPPEHHTGMMLAFMLDTEIARQLALPGGEPVNDLHVTLAYLGDMEDDAQDGLLRPHTSPDEIKDAIASIASDRSPLVGKVAGIGRFTTQQDGDPTPVYASVDIPGLVELRTVLVNYIRATLGYYVANDHGFTPHITLAYIDADQPMPIETVPPLPLVFNEVCLAIGDDRYFFKLGGDTPDGGNREGEEHVKNPKDQTTTGPKEQSVPLADESRNSTSAQTLPEIAQDDDGRGDQGESARICENAPDVQPFGDILGNDTSEKESKDSRSALSGARQEILATSESTATITDDGQSAPTEQLVTSSFFESKHDQWRPPSPTQLALEKDLATAIEAYISKSHVAKDGVTLPDETAHEHLQDAFYTALTKAVQEGRQIALGDQSQESLVSAAQNLAGRAVDVIGGIVTQLKERAQALIDSIFGGDEVPENAQDELESELEAWAGDYSTMVAENEVHAAVEGAIYSEMQKAGIKKMKWVCDPDACDNCRHVAEQGPIDVTGEWEGGITCPPAHVRCHCHVVPA